jgi:predicted enzyme related to lactoylglutathione lyase
VGESGIGNVIYPATDVAAAVSFYGTALGLATKFVDGDRYAALDGGGVTLAITGGGEDVTGGRVAASFRVPDVAAAVRAAEAAGATVLAPPAEGPHEVRAVLADPWGNPLVLYARRVTG